MWGAEGLTVENVAGQTTGVVFDIKRYAVHDGPGIRTTVFLKGCPLRCLWCHSPESQHPYQEILYFKNLCISCSECLRVCPHEAQTTDIDHKIRRDRCMRCGRCVESCYPGALKTAGRTLTVETVVDTLTQDAAFYQNSGGGITISGGEPTMQPEFTLELLRRCKAKGYHTALDTCGHVTGRVLAGLLRYVDLVLYDLKHMDSVRHRELTGVSNHLILANLRRIDRQDQAYVIRVPLIPTCNDSEANIEAMATFFQTLKHMAYIEILPYHGFGVSKYEHLGRAYCLSGLQPPSQDRLKRVREQMQRHGLTIKLESLQ